MEPSDLYQDSQDENWLKAMNEELHKIEKNPTWKLVPRPTNNNIIGTKWVFRNKVNKNGKVVRNKERLICKGYA